MNADARDMADSRVIVEDRSDWLRRRKNKRQVEKYGVPHKRRRADFKRRIERGELVLCLRCEGEIGPDQEWELDHDDHDPSQSFPAHRWCNRRAANLTKTSIEW